MAVVLPPTPGAPLTPLEYVAAILGVIAVYLGTRQSVWSWPFGIANVSLYFVIFREQRLYADMGLQAIYAALSAYGWYAWARGSDRSTPLPVTRVRRSFVAAAVPIAVIGWLALGTFLDRQTDAVLPYLDSLLTALSLVAQLLLARKVLENWMLWIAVDLVYVPMFISRGMYPTAVLYGIFLALAFLGLRDWRRDLSSAFVDTR